MSTKERIQELTEILHYISIEEYANLIKKSTNC